MISTKNVMHFSKKWFLRFFSNILSAAQRLLAPTLNTPGQLRRTKPTVLRDVSVTGRGFTFSIAS